MTTLYHGSNEDLTELDGNDPTYSGSLGWGLYLTPDPEFAAHFGTRIYEVESPVPDELVAYIDPNLYECGDSMTMGTPGSSPFMFEIVDRNTGEMRRYSVLEDCEEQVRDQLRRDALERFKPSQELSDDVNGLLPTIATRVGVGAKQILDAAIRGHRTDDAIDSAIETMAEDGVDESVLDHEVKPLLEAFEQELDTFADEWVARQLGDEIGLDDLSATVRSHGYSAFLISGYSPGGDEYVVVDESFLPIPVNNADVQPNARQRAPEQIVAALPEIVARAQAVYDDWAQDEDGFDEELGEGGICHLIADEVVDVLTNAGVEAKPAWSEGVGENHVWALAKIPDGPHKGVWMVDIPPEVYESGSGYSWKKKPDVAIHRDHVVLYHESVNPDDFDYGE